MTGHVMAFLHSGFNILKIQSHNEVKSSLGLELGSNTDPGKSTVVPGNNSKQ